MKKLTIISLILLAVLAGCVTTTTGTSIDSISRNYISDEMSSHVSNFVSIKYRSDAVDIASPQFEELDTSRSSFVRGAWYDSDKQYMIIKLSGTYYHYCGMPQSMWREFKNASSFGKKYNASIKENYDCRLGVVPEY